MAGNWPPEGLVGNSAIIVIRLSMFGPEKYRCPAANALTAHGLRPRGETGRKPEALDPFPHGPFMAAAHRLERSPGAKLSSIPIGSWHHPLHDGVRQWTQHALRIYQDAFPANTDLVPARGPWVYKSQPGGEGTVQYHITAWGRFLESRDGRIRELRLPSNRLRKRSETERAVAALVAAEGNNDRRVERVRVVQFALSDGRAEEIFNGTRDEAKALYRADGAPAVRALLAGREYKPGTACASCAFASVCPALQRAPGLLGVADRTRPRRSWSSTLGRGYKICPARAYLRDLRLPVDDSVERGPAAERGRAVHAFLAKRHERRPCTPCSPDIPPDWLPKGYQISDDQQKLGATLLRHHAEVCPLRRTGPGSEVRVERALVFDDTAADVLVLAEPDLLYRDGNAWVWRETKTSGSDRACRDVMNTYPQLALAVRIIGGGLPSASRSKGRVELEVLRPGGVDLRTLDPFAPATQAAAEAVLSDQVLGWHSDVQFQARPSHECGSCEMARWCSARSPRPGEEARQ
ncbi:hypothetical protein GCM10022252_78490 [Streptosporangium oxazolinicum]|uniref:PD-(D/E)XK endonuclease-like domain-containing protein n=1 Tax=Streptosporangium oxazolinicum TaxID=909287 RepID=A0ABP8BML8_9ACTN